MDVEDHKRAAAQAAAELVQDGMRVGLGTGSTVRHLLPAIAARGLTGLRCVATSVDTDVRARAAGLAVEPFDALDELDLVIDGADQVAPDGWLVKGGGGAHLREKIVAAASARFVVIVDATKVVDALHAPIPLELLPFGLQATLHHLQPVTLRDAAMSPDHGLIADFHGDVAEPAALAARLSAVPGVVEHGLFPAAMVHEVLVAGSDGVERRRLR
jgi:ribose 5-phosphate isomerase A